MGMQRFRADKATKQADGAIVWHAHWMGGPTLAKIERCRIDGTDLRRTVYTTGEPDIFYSVPAVMRGKGGARVVGYLTGHDDGRGMEFRPMTSHAHLVP